MGTRRSFSPQAAHCRLQCSALQLRLGQLWRRPCHLLRSGTRGGWGVFALQLRHGKSLTGAYAPAVCTSLTSVIFNACWPGAMVPCMTGWCFRQSHLHNVIHPRVMYLHNQPAFSMFNCVATLRAPSARTRAWDVALLLETAHLDALDVMQSPTECK